MRKEGWEGWRRREKREKEGEKDGRRRTWTENEGIERGEEGKGRGRGRWEWAKKSRWRGGEWKMHAGRLGGKLCSEKERWRM